MISIQDQSSSMWYNIHIYVICSNSV